MQEIFKPKRSAGKNGCPDLVQVSSGYDMEFIICRHCENATMMIEYAHRQVLTREEAERLVAKEGFTYWGEGRAAGTMARPISRLGFLAAADLAHVRTTFVEARKAARKEKDPLQRGNLFARNIDPALLEIMNKARETNLAAEARERLQGIFGRLWERVGSECRDFLLTAEVLKDELVSLTETDPSIDFSPVVAAYSKALEKELLDKIFMAFKETAAVNDLPTATAQSHQGKSMTALRDFIAGRRELTLGDMAFCLKNLGRAPTEYTDNRFTRFIVSHFRDADLFAANGNIPDRILEFVREFRNRSAHVSRITKTQCMAARAYLIEEPVHLLLALEEATTAGPA